MSTKKRIYTIEVKQEAVALWETSGQPASAIERELGIIPGLLSKWRRDKGLPNPHLANGKDKMATVVSGRRHGLVFPLYCRLGDAARHEPDLALVGLTDGNCQPATATWSVTSF